MLTYIWPAYGIRVFLFEHEMPPFLKGYTVKERNLLSLGTKSFHLKYPLLGEFFPFRVKSFPEANANKKLSLLLKMAENLLSASSP